MPITISQSPVAPLMSLCDVTGAFIGLGFRTIDIWGGFGLRATDRASQAGEHDPEKIMLKQRV
jgi:hypothetical protein